LDFFKLIVNIEFIDQFLIFERVNKFAVNVGQNRQIGIVFESIKDSKMIVFESISF